MSITLLQGDAREMLDALGDGSAQMIVTSPPYWRLRRYTNDPREVGQEDTPSAYAAALADVFERCRRVLRDDGTLWLNLGDAYANDTKWGGRSGGKNYTSAAGGCIGQRAKSSTGLPPKSLIGLPWRVAFALQDAGWVLRNEIIWHKPSVMPEAVTDRCARDHETLFLFSKSPRYFFDHKAISEPIKSSLDTPSWTERKAGGATAGNNGVSATYQRGVHGRGMRHDLGGQDGLRNPRTVWSISAQGLRDEHYAPMPQALAERCIKAGSRPGDTVLDPFAGSGTTGRAALALQRNAVLIDLGYADLQERRTDGVQVQMVELL